MIHRRVLATHLALLGVTLVLPAAAADAPPTPSLSPALAQPGSLHRRFAEAFNAADLPALLALYEPSAAFVPQPGDVAVGRERIGTILSSFLRIKGTLQLGTVGVVEAGDLALLRGQYQLAGIDGDGKPVVLQGRTVEVARRQADGTWLFAIDFPNGAD